MYVGLVVILGMAVKGCKHPKGDVKADWVKDKSRIEKLWAQIRNCETEPYSPAVCDWEEIPTKRFGRLRIGKKVGAGDFGTVFDVANNSDLIVKISHETENGIESICQEKAVLIAIDGLNGGAPKSVDLGSMGEECSKRILVMEKKGELDFKEATSESVAFVSKRFSTLLGLLRSLHDMGIVHADIRSDNIRINPSNPAETYFIDFGIATPYVDQSGTLLSVVTPIDDLKMLVAVFQNSPISAQEWFKTFANQVRSASVETRLPYEQWEWCADNSSDQSNSLSVECIV
jgi:serine/threonine protein kinase